MKHVLRLSGALLIAAGLLLFFWQDIREIFIDRVNDRMIESYHDDSRPVEVNRLESFVTGVDQSASYDMEGVAGVLRIESADIEEPVFSGPVTEEKLKSGLSFVDAIDHVDMQNIPIAGHRVEGAGIRFNHLDRAAVGDIVEFGTGDEVRSYEITDMFEVDPSQVEVLDQKRDHPQQLTLITCEDYNPETLLFEKRLIVKATIME
ncbi:class A sortase [Salinicoccus luteus]|uniref:class A sortase n=1 Tax=Salinicoccus luteus TaxID=367840 RepID=UPI0004E1E6DD|nr:class A sortase [Salinicoccus luteus]